MPHSRQRHLLPLLLKRLRFAPVVALQGARQTGKSFLVRELLKSQLPASTYKTFDQASVRSFAESNPESFLAANAEAAPLILDEAQKVPAMFDAVKFEVDQDRQPGRFLLLGSTEFSRLTRIRESLTGRMSRLRLFPLTLAEAQGHALNGSRHPLHFNEKARASRVDLMRHLERGGMPGIFAVREAAERRSLLQDWLDLTVERDTLMFSASKVDPTLCRAILELLATIDEPEIGRIASQLRQDARRIRSHVNVLETLFVVHRLDPHPSSTGKPRYFLCDVGLARVLGADLERQLYTWLLSEQLSQRVCRDDRDTKLSYYRTSKGSLIHLLAESGGAARPVLTACKLISKETFRDQDFEVLRAFREKQGEGACSLVAFGPQRASLKPDKIEIYPWESLG